MQMRRELWQLQFSATPLPPLSVLEAPNPLGPTAASSATGLSPQESNPTAATFLTEAEADRSVQNPLVLETEVRIPQRHDPLTQEVSEGSLQDVCPSARGLARGRRYGLVLAGARVYLAEH